MKAPAFEMIISFTRRVVNNGKFTTVTNGKIEDILRNNNGVYTTCRSFNKKIFMLNEHLERLQNGAHACKIEFDSNDMNIIREMIKGNLNSYDRITIVVDKDNIFASFGNVFKLPDAVSIQMSEGKRDNANVKSVKWVNQRQELEKNIKNEVNEVVLTHNDNCYEGLSSNFFIVMNGLVYTAPLDAVLPGTVQKLVAELFPLQMRYQFPKLIDVNLWDAAMISSTSRLVIPINKIHLENGDVVQLDPVNPFLMEVKDAVYRSILNKSEYPYIIFRILIQIIQICKKKIVDQK